MIISGQSPDDQTPEGKLRKIMQDRQNMQMGRSGASYLMRPKQTPPAMGQPGTAPQPTLQQLQGVGGNACPTCGAPMNSSNTEEEMGNAS